MLSSQNSITFDCARNVRTPCARGTLRTARLAQGDIEMRVSLIVRAQS